MSTPLRSVAPPVGAGIGVLRSSDGVFSDGSEGHLAEILASARDLSSMSDELEAAGHTWAERYHLAKGRANVIRALDLPPAGRVLEIGAGCGAITRHLGESCSLVDAVEPSTVRATAAASRTRDLENVSVYAGTVSEIPEEPAYDLIVVVGVLEYVAGGTASPGPYVSFLDTLRRRLLPGGSLVCAIENQLGAKYLCGAPEDHSNRSYDGIEGYPDGAPARTFSRPALAGLFAAAGLDARFLHAFPDYKLARLVFGDALVLDPATRDLAWRIPSFPSPDWLGERPRGPAERNLWRTIVDSEIGLFCSNSFVVIAGEGSGSHTLWPDGRLASYFTTNRRACFATRTDVVCGDPHTAGPVRMLRRLMTSDSRSVEVDDVRLEVSDSDLIPGRDLVDVLSADHESDVDLAVGRWVEFATAAQAGERRIRIDLVPHNIVVGDDGVWHSIDQEWDLGSSSLDFLLQRGVFWLGIQLAQTASPARWPDDWLVLDLVQSMGRSAGLGTGGPGWIDAMLEEEATVQATVHGADRDSPGYESLVEEHRCELTKALAHPLSRGPLGLREQDLRRTMEAELAVHHDHLDRANDLLVASEKQIAHLELEVENLEAELGEIRTMLSNSRGWQLVTRIDRIRKAMIRAAGGRA